MIRFAEWQSVIINDRETETIYLHGGLGSGKTFGKVAKHINWVLENKGCPFSWFIEPAYHKVDSIAIPAFKDYFNLLGWKEKRHYEFVRSKPQKLKIYHGLGTHTILFQSSDRPQLMIGDNIGYYTSDETGDSKYEAIERADHRLRDKKANYRQAVIGGAPQGLNFFAEMANFNAYRPEENALSLELWTEDNQHNLAPEYIERLLRRFGHNQAKVQAWLYGRFTSFQEGQCYQDYDPQKDRHENDPDPDLPLWSLWDFNVKPLAWVGLQKQRFFDSTGFRPVDKLISVGESKGISRLIHDACGEFVATYDPRVFKNTPIWISGDATGLKRDVREAGNAFDDIKKYLSQLYTNVRLMVPQSNPYQHVRVEAVNRLFSYGRLLVHKGDDCLNQSLVKTVWSDKTGKIGKPSGEDWTHWADAFGYGVYQISELENINLDNLPTHL